MIGSLHRNSIIENDNCSENTGVKWLGRLKGIRAGKEITLALGDAHSNRASVLLLTNRVGLAVTHVGGGVYQDLFHGPSPGVQATLFKYGCMSVGHCFSCRRQ